MRVGVVKEIKANEQRVALTPGGAAELAARGHEVLVEQGAGSGAGFADAAYAAAGAAIVGDAPTVWATSELLLKVKEPIAEEYGLLHSDLTLFTYLHLAPNPDLTAALVRSGATAIAYETVEDADGGLPLLAPMSLIAGRLAAQIAAQHLLAPEGGPGILMGGVPGARRARIMVIGGGMVGAQAARVAAGLEADVYVLDRSYQRLLDVDQMFYGSSAARVHTLPSNPGVIGELLPTIDVVIGAVLIRGARAPRLVTRAMLKEMRPGALLVDVAIDQGGCFETSSATTHAEPTYRIDGVRHYCVANMPGAVPVTSTAALTAATLEYVRRLADLGTDHALEADPGLAKGVNVRGGEITYGPVAEAMAAEAVAPA
jgi:alanine dehydrogenase